MALYLASSYNLQDKEIGVSSSAPANTTWSATADAGYDGLATVTVTPSAAGTITISSNTPGTTISLIKNNGKSYALAKVNTTLANNKQTVWTASSGDTFIGAISKTITLSADLYSYVNHLIIHFQGEVMEGSGYATLPESVILVRLGEISSNTVVAGGFRYYWAGSSQWQQRFTSAGYSAYKSSSNQIVVNCVYYDRADGTDNYAIPRVTKIEGIA